MGSTTKGPYDPTSTAPVDTLLGNSVSGCILIHNLSQYELVVSTPDNIMQSFVAAWGWRRFDADDPMPLVQWSIAATPAQSNPPLSAVFVESYELRENAPPQYFGVYQRQTSVGNNVATTFNQITPDGGAHGLTAAWDAANSRINMEPGGSAATAPMGQALTYRDASGIQRVALKIGGDGTGSLGGTNGTAFTWDASGNITPAGAIKSLGGQASAGAFGAPVIVAQTIRFPVTVTTLQTILSFTPPVTGLYRISGCFFMGNTANELITFGLTATDEDGTIGNQHFVLPASTTSLDGSATTVGHGFDWAIVPYVFNLSSAGAITVTYRDPAGTPNDFVTVIIERLA